MIKLFRYDDIDMKKWDACIQGSFNGNIYAYSWFLDIVAGEWDALIQGDYERVFPLTWKKSFGVYHLYQPFFTQQLGIYSKNILTREVVQDFLDHIPEEYQYIEIFLNAYNKIDQEKYNVQPQVNHELDLIKPYENLHRTYSKNLKRNLKKAEKEKFSVSKNLKPDEVIGLFRKNRGKNIAHLKEGNYKRLSRLLYTCVFKKAAKVYGVYSGNNELLAGAVFVTGNRRAIFLFSGLSEEGKKAGAMPFLIDAFIRDNANTHLTFDFDGSNDPNLARFYKSFGAKETSYPRLIINKLPMHINILYKLRKKLL